MKKLNLFVALASLCVALTVCVACSEIALPDSLAMKVDAPFDFDVEMNMFDLSDKINVGNISSQSCKVYNYSIGDNVKHFLVTLDAFAVDIDINTITAQLANVPGFSTISTYGWPSGLPAQNISINKTEPFAADFDFSFKDTIKKNISDATLSGFLDKLDLRDISAYLYISKSPANVLKNIQATGSIYIAASQSPASTDYILGDTSNKASVEISTTQITDWSTQGNISKHSGLTNLKSGPIKTFLNSQSVSSNTGQYDFDCAISIGEADFNALTASSTPLKLSSTIIVDVPLVFEATNQTDLELMKLDGMKNQTDILGRGGPNSDFDKFTDVFEYLSLGITPTNQNIFSSDVTISIKDTNNENIFGTTGQSKNINNKDKFTIQKTNIKNLMDTAPYMPEIKLSIPQNGTLSFPEDSVIKMYMSVNAYANGTVKVF